MNLPDEIQMLIIENINDFTTFCSTHFVSKLWNKKIIEIRDAAIWKFSNRGKLPNGKKHGMIPETCACCTELFRFGQRIGKYSDFKNNNFLINNDADIYIEYHQVDSGNEFHVSLIMTYNRLCSGIVLFRLDAEWLYMMCNGVKDTYKSALV